MIYLALIAYCTIVYGIHGGEGVIGVNRQFRNMICAVPFAAVFYYLWDLPEAVAAFALAYIGSNMGFNRWPLWLKGLITFPLGGFATLPLAYLIGYKTRWTNVIAEYLSGTFYGILLCLLLEVTK